MPRKLEPDYRILAVAVCLVLIGMAMIYSSSSSVAAYRYGDSSYFLKRQIVWALVGGVGMILAMRVNYHRLERLGFPLYILAIVMLVMVLLPFLGKEVGGARRWLSLGPLSFQPSEFAKLAMIIFFASFLVKKEKAGRLKDFMGGFVPCAAALGVCFLLILTQPDLGTSLVLATVIFSLFFIAGIRKRYILGSVLMVIPFLWVAILNVDYRRRRILSFLDPWADPSDSGFQIIQSYVALGNGHYFGRGLGGGMQKNFYLPDAHTDFIFSILGEETGFAGCMLVILLFVLLIYLGFKVAYRAPEPFGMYLASGITLNIGIQTAVNIGVATGLLPTKGLPLPFISIGGSALVMWMVSLGILLNVSEHTT